MLNSIKKTFTIVGKNLILAQPFILFLLVISLLGGGLYSVQSNLAAFSVFALSILLLAVAFMAGWFFMTKKTIEFEYNSSLTDEEKALKSFGLIKHFFPGVGENFISMIGLSILYFIFASILFFAAYRLGVHYFGAPNIDVVQLNAASGSYASMQSYFSSLPADKLYNLVSWLTYMSLCSFVFQFFTMWWVPALYYSTKNPLKAFGCAIKFLFLKFGASLGIFFFLLMFNFIVSYVNAALAQNVLLSLIGFVLFFYYATYYVVLIFLYYGKHNKLPQTENNFDSGFDIDGEKLAGGEDSGQA